MPSRGISRDPSFDKINVKLASSRDQIRSQSKTSDTSEALPDLELEDELTFRKETEMSGNDPTFLNKNLPYRKLKMQMQQQVKVQKIRQI